MTLRYKVDSKLPEPVFIDVDQVVELIPVEEYMSELPLLEGFDPNGAPANAVFCPPEYRAIGNSSYHPVFAKLYQPVKLDNGTIILVLRPKEGEVKIGDYVRYDVGCDDFTLFETQIFACKLTLVENTNAS